MQLEIILVGGGGHCKSCIDVIHLDKTYRIAGIVDTEDKLHQTVMEYRVIGSDAALPEIARQYTNFLVTLGQIKDARKRIAIYSKLKNLGVSLPIITSPLAYVAPDVTLKDGTIVMHHAIVNSGAALGENCIVNTRALIEHDAVISDHCHISTAAVVNGGARIGRGSFIGSLAMIRDNIDIGENCVIGAGQVILRNIDDNTIFKSGL